jgi:hypothetical protein
MPITTSAAGMIYEDRPDVILRRNHPKSLAVADRRLRAAFGNGLLTSRGRHPKDRGTFGVVCDRWDRLLPDPERDGFGTETFGK